MKASAKIKPAKVSKEPKCRRPSPKPGVRVKDVSGMVTVAAHGITSFVSLPREPWTKEAAQ